MSLTPIFLLALTVASILVAALAGSTRRLGFWLTLVASIFLTPLIGFAIAALSGRKRWPEERPRRVRPRRLAWLRGAQPKIGNHEQSAQDDHRL